MLKIAAFLCGLFGAFAALAIPPRVCEITGADASGSVRRSTVGKNVVLQFDGVPGHAISRPAQPLVDRSFSYYAWVKPTRMPERDVAAFISRPGQHVKLAWTAAGRFRFTLWQKDGTKFFVESPAYDEQQWYMVVGVYDRAAGLLRLFVNGRQVAATRAPSALAPNAHDIFFGAGAPRNHAFPCPFAGFADRLRVYDGALELSEINEMYRQEACDYGIDPDHPQVYPAIPLPSGKLNFKDGAIVRLASDLARVSADGSSLTLKSGQDFRGRTLLATRPGLLRKNTIYTVSLSYKVNTENQSKNARAPYFLFGCKSLSRPDIHHIIKTKGAAVGKRRTFQFMTKDDVDDYIFYVDLWNRLEGTLADLEIRETAIQDGFIPAVAGEKPYAGKLPPAPTGCPEFEVQLPNGNGEVVDATRFGVSTAAADNTEAFQKAIDYCITHRAAKLIFPKGRYAFTGKGVTITGAENLDIDFGHSDFIYCKDLKDTKVNIVMRASRRVRFINLNADWDWEKMPLASLVEVVGVDGDVIDFKFLDYEYYPKRDVRVCMLSEIDPVTRRLDLEHKTVFHMEFYLGKYVPETTWLSGNVLRVKERGNDWNKAHLYFFRKGQFFRMLHAYYEGGMFLVEDCSDITFDSINIYSTTGKNFHFRGMKNWQLLRVNCAPPANNPKRLVSSTADGYGHERCFGNFKMENCRFAYGNDDFMNFQDTNVLVLPQKENSVITRNLRGPAPVPGDMVALLDGNLKDLNYCAQVTSVRELPQEEPKPGMPWGYVRRKRFEIVLNVPLPPTESGSYVMFNLKFNSGNVILRNCIFENTDGSGRFQASNVTIENCIFRHNSNRSLHFSTGYTLDAWCEGQGVDNMIVRNCIFDFASGARRNIAEQEIDCSFNAYTPSKDHGVSPAPVFRNILIENNRFINTAGVLAWIQCAENIVFCNNLVVNNIARKNNMSYRGAFVVLDSRCIYIVNNRYIQSPYVSHPGVFFQPQTTVALVASGNTVSIDHEK